MAELIPSTMSPRRKTDSGVTVVDSQTTMEKIIAKQSEKGLPTIDDWAEGNKSNDGLLPAGLPKTIKNPKTGEMEEVHYMLMAIDGLERNKLWPYSRPVTRDMPGVSESLFNIRDHVQIGDCIVCYMLKSVHDAIKKEQKRLFEDRLRPMNGSQYEHSDSKNGRITGEVEMKLEKR